jgi:hypothetical protein
VDFQALKAIVKICNIKNIKILILIPLTKNDLIYQETIQRRRMKIFVEKIIPFLREKIHMSL